MKFARLVLTGLFLAVPTLAHADLPQINQTVLIQCGNAQGAGFYIKPDLILTARHLAKNCSSASIRDNAGQTAIGKVVFLSNISDMGLISTTVTFAKGVLINFDSNPIKNGEAVTTVGAPINGLVLSAGDISNIQSSISPDSFEIAIAADHGNSGGAVFSQNGIVGELVGINESNNQVVAVGAPALEAGISQYEKSVGNNNKSDTSSAVNNSPKIVYLKDTKYQTAFAFSLIGNFVLLAVVVFLFLLRKKRFSGKKIVIQLDQEL